MLVGANVGATSTQSIPGIADMIDAVRDVEAVVIRGTGSIVSGIARSLQSLTASINSLRTGSATPATPGLPGAATNLPGAITITAGIVNVSGAVRGGGTGGRGGTRSGRSGGGGGSLDWRQIKNFTVSLAAAAGISLTLKGAFQLLTTHVAGVTDKFREMSPQMARVAAERDVRELMRGMHVGNLLAPGQRQFVNAQQDFKDAIAPLEIKLTEILQVINTQILQYAADIAKNSSIGIDVIQHFIENVLANPGILMDIDALGKAFEDAQKRALDDFRRKMVPVVAAVPWREMIIAMADFDDGLRRMAP